MNKVKSLFGTTPQGHAGLLVKESQYVWRYDTQDRACEVALGGLSATHGWGMGRKFYRLFTRLIRMAERGISKAEVD